MAKVAKRRNRYVLDFYDNQGKRRRKTLPAGTTLKKAKEKLREIEEQVCRGNWLPETKIPLFKDVAKDWLEHKKLSIRASTWAAYDGHTRNHFADFDNLKINRITTAMIEKWMNVKISDGVNIKTLRKIDSSMGQILAYSVRHGYLNHNPMVNAERPRDINSYGGTAINILPLEKISSFLAAAPNQKYRTLFKLAIMSGARQGELLGLKWTDVLWSTGQIHIKRSYNNFAWYQPKTKTSRRKIDLGPTTLAELKRWRIACSPCELDLVFPSQIGGPINCVTMRKRHFYPTLKRAGIKRIRFHDLRHTYASILIDQGENIKYIQSQLGHSTPTVTLNIYSHLLKPTNQEAARRLEERIFGTSEKVDQTGHNLVTINKESLNR